MESSSNNDVLLAFNAGLVSSTHPSFKFRDPIGFLPLMLPLSQLKHIVKLILSAFTNRRNRFKEACA